MQLLNGTNIYLRAIEPEDLDFLFQIENNEAFWEISHTQKPFSKYELKKYLENAHLDLYEVKQLRLIITSQKNKEKIGIIDLFDFNPQHKRAGIGIVIAPKYQNKGIASEALTLLINYAFKHLSLHQLYANITNTNTQSIRLFEQKKFKKTGVKTDWIFTNGVFKDEILYQLINN